MQMVVVNCGNSNSKGRAANRVKSGSQSCVSRLCLTFHIIDSAALFQLFIIFTTLFLPSEQQRALHTRWRPCQISARILIKALFYYNPGSYRDNPRLLLLSLNKYFSKYGRLGTSSGYYLQNHEQAGSDTDALVTDESRVAKKHHFRNSGRRARGTKVKSNVGYSFKLE